MVVTDVVEYTRDGRTVRGVVRAKRRDEIGATYSVRFEGGQQMSFREGRQAAYLSVVERNPDAYTEVQELRRQIHHLEQAEAEILERLLDSNKGGGN